MDEAAGRLTVIAHVACNNTRDSRILAAHAQSLGVDGIAAIPPIYFKLPEYSAAGYWNDISRQRLRRISLSITYPSWLARP